MQLRHIGLVTPDIESSLAFYQKWFKCQVVRKMEERGDFISLILGEDRVDVVTVKLMFPEGDGQLELLSFKNPISSSKGETNLFSQGLTHFAIQVQNLMDLYGEMKSEGIEFASSPQLSEDKKARVCFCRDPQGVYLELVELLS